MDEPEVGRGDEISRVASGRSRASALVAVALLATACSQRPAPETPASAVTPQTMTPASPPPEAPVVDPPRAAEPPRSSEPIYIESAEAPQVEEQSLAAVAAAERERRQAAGAPMIRIDDKNLAQHATGKLTFSSGDGPATGAPAATTPAPVHDEQYWRGRVRGIRERWAETAESIDELEARAASLRTRFYAEDDPYVRDGKIKPAWDRALENLETAKGRVRELQDELAMALEDGRQEGAEPGWLSDGIELEPIAEKPRDKGEPVDNEGIFGEPKTDQDDDDGFPAYSPPGG